MLSSQRLDRPGRQHGGRTPLPNSRAGERKRKVWDKGGGIRGLGCHSWCNEGRSGGGIWEINGAGLDRCWQRNGMSGKKDRKGCKKLTKRD